MSQPDGTSERVRALLMGAAAEAYLLPPRLAAYDPRLVCGCSHWADSHHGKLGEGRCGEPDCDCEAWHPAIIECPRCLTPMPDEVCPTCGLTLDAIAERLAREHALWLQRERYR